VGKKKAKEMWFMNPKLTAREALEIGLINRVVPDDELLAETRKMAEAVAERGAFALAALKGAFVARHGGVSGLSRISHDMLLRLYLDTDEAKELGEAFRGRRTPDAGKFGH
jgi:naphthoate synthase